MSISEIHVGSLIRVKVGRNLIYAKVIEILDGAVRVPCSYRTRKTGAMSSNAVTSS